MIPKQYHSTPRVFHYHFASLGFYPLKTAKGLLIINTIQQYSKCFIIGRPLDNHKYNFSTSHSILQLL